MPYPCRMPPNPHGNPGGTGLGKQDAEDTRRRCLRRGKENENESDHEGEEDEEEDKQRSKTTCLEDEN